MSTPILATKLYIPPACPELVPRPHLIERLNESLRRKLTLISAPAGFGKTTLVSSWICQKGAGGEQEDGQVAWVSLDERDNDPAQFWHYVIAALQTIDAGLGETVQATLESSQLPSLEALVTVLLNDLVEFQADKGQILPLLLVLDDYHLIVTEAIHNSLNFLIDHLPPSVHLTITTRSDPPLRLSHRRGRSEMTQIRAADLSFSRDEVAKFFNTLMGLNLSQAEINSLESRTEGWIAGLQLAALSLQDQADRHTFVTDFAGNDRYVADYLMDEVLHHQPSFIQTFLLQTSILDQLCAPLCYAVTGQKQSRTILTQLERANLFLIPLDNRREWYRYHQLFADLLRQRLQESHDVTDIARLHQQACQWYEDRGEVIEAVDHAMLAGDYQNVAELIEQYVQEIFDQFKLNALVKWMRALPGNLVATRPRLCMIYGWALLATGHSKEAEHCMQSIENSVGAQAETITTPGFQALDPEVRGALIEVIVLRSVLAIAQFNIPRTLELCQQVLPYLKDNSQPYLFDEPLELRTVVVFNMGLAYEFSGEGDAAAEALTEAVMLSREQENINILPTALAHLGQLQMLQGHLYQAERTYRQALQLATEVTGRPSPLAGIAETGLGKLLYERNDLAGALHHFNAGISLAKRWNYTEGLLAGYTGLAQLKQAQGDGAGALALLQELTDLLQQVKAQMLLPAVDTCRTRLWIAQGDLAEATRWVQKSGLTVDGDLSYFQENDYLILARLLIAQERWNEAAGLIARLLDYAETGERWGRIIELLMLQALVFNGQGKSVQAQSTLSRVLTLTEPEGYGRLFVDEGPQMARLLRLAAAEGINPDYIDQLLRAFAAGEPGDERVKGIKTTSANALVEPLSDREIEVIQCIAEGLSNREIAQKLTISLTTVKSHTRNIYGKLGVNSRTQAVAQARAWGILPTT
jgi:LuxR family maltose regulon positive regulatory protein